MNTYEQGTQLHSSSHSSKIMLKIIQARFQQYMNCELADVQAVFRKGRGTRDEVASIHHIIEKAREFQETPASLTVLKPLTVWITTNWKILKQMGIPDNLTCLLRTCMQVKKQELEPDMEKWTGSKLGKKYVKAVH